MTIQVQRFDFVISVVIFGWFYIAVYSIFFAKIFSCGIVEKADENLRIAQKRLVFRSFFDFLQQQTADACRFTVFFQLSWGLHIFCDKIFVGLKSLVY